MYYVYMLRCKDNSLYTGITIDVEKRMTEHFQKSKRCAKYTKQHDAQKLESVWETNSRRLASKLEYYIKTLDKKKKEELVQTGNLGKFFGEKIEVNEYTSYRFRNEF